MPNLAAVVTVTTHRFVHLIVRALQAQLRQLMVETQRQAARFRIGKIVTTNAGIQPFHAVQDQTINRVAGGKCQTTENVVIEIGKRIGVIGTAATIRSGSYATQLKDLVPGVQIFARACPLFVPLVENGYVNGDKVTQLMIEEYLTPVRDSGIDTLILGCTHYPLLKKMIGDFVGDSVTLIDPGKLTAIAAATALDDLGISSGRSTGGTTRFFVSDTPDGFAKQERLFMGSEAGGPVEQIAIETY